MQRDKLVRALRITWTVFWGIVCVLLVVLWVRSYFYLDALRGPISETKRLHVGSLAGGTQVRLADRKWSDPDSSRHWTIATDSVAKLNEVNNLMREMLAQLGAPPARTRIDWTMTIGWRQDTLFLPYWLLLLMICAPAVAVGMCRPFRFSFSLRTLLIATTAIAVMLGVAVWFLRS